MFSQCRPHSSKQNFETHKKRKTLQKINNEVSYEYAWAIGLRFSQDSLLVYATDFSLWLVRWPVRWPVKQNCTVRRASTNLSRAPINLIQTLVLDFSTTRESCLAQVWIKLIGAPDRISREAAVWTKALFVLRPSVAHQTEAMLWYTDVYG